MAILTRISYAKKGTKSLRTTIPEAVVELLGLEDKDDLEWKIVAKGENEVAAIIRRSGQRYLKTEHNKGHRK